MTRSTFKCRNCLLINSIALYEATYMLVNELVSPSDMLVNELVSPPDMLVKELVSPP